MLSNYYFQPSEYGSYLQKTNVMILRYRVSSYNLCVSGVLIEALVNAIPVIVTNGTTLAEQIYTFGVSVES